MEKIKFKIGGKIFDGEKFVTGDILVENGKIARVGKIEEPCDIEYELTGDVCLRLVDIHTHLKGISCDEYGTPADLACIPFGVTAAVDGGAEKGGKALLDTFTVSTAAFIPAFWKDGRLDKQKIERIWASFEEKALGLKVYFDRTQNDLSADDLQTVCDYAAELGAKVMVHCSYSPVPMKQIVEILRAGDILTHIYHGGECTIADENYAAYTLAKEKGVVLDAGMAGGVHTDFQVLKRAIEQGYLPDTVSTDVTRRSTCVRGGIYGLTACMSIFKELGMNEESLFKAVSGNAARAVGKQTEWGLLREGAPADFAVLSLGERKTDIVDKAGNRLSFDRGYQCRATVVNGRILYRI